MKRLLPRLMLVAAFTASAALAQAQAVHRGGGESSSSSGSSGSSSSGGGSSTASSSGGGSTFSSPPAHSAPPRTPSHSAGSGGSVDRGSSSASSGGSHAGTAAIRRPDGGSTAEATAPTYSRPDGSGYNYNGYAVPRTHAPVVRPPVYIYPPYYIYNPWAFGSFGYGYGLSYFYDPFWWGYSGWGWPDYGYYGGSSYYDTWESRDQYTQQAPTGQLRIKVKPREARVIVDGAFVGTVDDFDGMFQKLSLTEGRHQVSLQLDGYEPLTFDVMIIAGQTVNYKGEMHKLTR